MVTGDKFTFKDGYPDDFDDDDEGDDLGPHGSGPYCENCWTYHRGECP